MFKIESFKYLGRTIKNSKKTVYSFSSMFPFHTLMTDTVEIELFKSNEIFITTPNSAQIGTGVEETWVRWENGVATRTKLTPPCRSYTIRNVYAYANTPNPKSLMSPEEYEILVQGDEIVQTNNVGMPEWRVSRKIYFKYFWLFYIVAKDYWDKYPDDIHIEPEDKDIILTEEEKKEILEQEKKVFEKALRLARENYPEFALAEEMVEEKKKEGTYLSELEAVYLESKRLKKNLGKEVDETNTN